MSTDSGMSFKQLAWAEKTTAIAVVSAQHRGEPNAHKERSFRYSCEGRHFRRSYKINDGSQLKKKKDGHIQHLKKATVFKAVFENKEQELP